jgi:putative oxidoreductase
MYDTKPFLMNISLLLARCSIGILLFYAGGGKVLGWFDYGVPETVAGMAKIGIPAPLAYMSIYTEFIGGFLLTVGLFTRPAAFAVMINMAVATLVTLPSGFIGPGGAQTPFLYLVIDVIVFLIGPMAFSVDHILFRSKKHIDRVYSHQPHGTTERDFS